MRMIGMTLVLSVAVSMPTLSNPNSNPTQMRCTYLPSIMLSSPSDHITVARLLQSSRVAGSLVPSLLVQWVTGSAVDSAL